MEQVRKLLTWVRVFGETMDHYEIGSYIMHENSGVCCVRAIEERCLSGKGSERMYYVLEPVFQNGSQVITPVDGAKQRIRDVIGKDEVQRILAQIRDLTILDAPNERMLAECYRECIATFEPMELARIVKTVFVRKRQRMESGKKMMSQDEKALNVAGKKLYEEMAFAMDLPVETIEQQITEKLADV